ncbi:MAG TPA: hypothetical protein VIE35_11435, partial [Dongiaceae bacterium]
MLIDLQDPAAPAIGAALLMLLIFMPIALWLRREMRQALRRGDARLADLDRLEEVLSTAPDGFFRWTLNDEGGIVDERCSRRLAVLLGL